MVADNDLLLPAGHGFRALNARELRERDHLRDLLLVWERPRRRGDRRYVMGVDVADGLGLDRSVIEVARMGTIEEPAEQVAQYVSDQISPPGLAYIVQAIGNWYTDPDGVPACAMIECNNHGLSTQDTLQLHLGYTHFYRWEYLDADTPESRFSRKIGWYTTDRTRPIILDKFRTALCTVDPITGLRDYVTHSSMLHEELQDFQTNGALWEAEAAAGAHDDCIMAAAIAHYGCWRLQAGETEPMDDRRRRASEQQARLAAEAVRQGRVLDKADWRNTPTTADEMASYVGDEPEDLDQQLFDPRQLPERDVARLLDSRFGRG
jgi:hypothetical protein